MPLITLPDGSQRSFDAAVTLHDVALDIGPGLAKAALAGKVNGFVVDTSFLIEHDSDVAIITERDEEEGEVVIDNRSIAGEHNYFFAPKWFFYSRAAFKQDDIASLNLRSNLGAGFGYQIFETEEQILDVNFGPSWLYHDYATDENTSAPAANWSLNYDQIIWESAFAIFHNHQLVVPLDQANAFIIESETGLRIPLHAGLVATGEVDFDWSNVPASGATEEDITYSLKLGYEW